VEVKMTGFELLMCEQKAAIATNAVRILVQQGTPTDTFRQEMERNFGAVAHFDMNPGWAGDEALVCFFDVRDAMKAKEFHGARSAYAQQHGQRAVLLDAEKKLNNELVDGEVSSIIAAPDGRFWVEFFDIRKAAAVAESTEVAAEAQVPSQSSRPQKIMEFRLQEVSWQGLKNKTEWRTSLNLRGLPRKLCDPGALENVMRQNGLMELVSDLRVKPPAAGARLGSAVITACSVDEVPKLAKFFHGRQFGSSAPVAVSFTSSQGPGLAKPLSLSADPLRVKAESKAKTTEPGCPQKLDVEYLNFATTTVGSLSLVDSGSDSDSAPETPSKVCHIAPPPGLEGFARSMDSLPAIIA